MKTSKPISTISYNTEPFLVGKLKELTKAKIIEFWAYIHHHPEDDEAGLKEHFHVWMVPARQIQTEDLRSEFMEMVDPAIKPLGVLPFHSSKKFDDWGLYSVHDPAYLAAKRQSRRYKYTWNMMQTSDEDELRRYVYEIQTEEFDKYTTMRMAHDSGLSFTEFVQSYNVPIQQIGGYGYAWKMLTQEHTDRAGRKGHDVLRSDDGEPIPPLEDCDIYKVLNDYQGKMMKQAMFIF